MPTWRPVHARACRRSALPLLLLACPAAQSQVSQLQRERAKVAILTEAVIVASTLSFAGGCLHNSWAGWAGSLACIAAALRLLNLHAGAAAN